MRKISNADLAWGRSWCVAGGWAACPQLATDQDVWIFVECEDVTVTPETLLDARQEILNRFEEIVPEASQDVGAVLATYGDLGYAVLKVGVLGDRHILVTSAEDVGELLESFDISTHQCAITNDVRFVKGPHWTPVTVVPRKLRQTETTDERFAKITNRYARLREAA